LPANALKHFVDVSMVSEFPEDVRKHVTDIPALARIFETSGDAGLFLKL
jgi:hypothetical protein